MSYTSSRSAAPLLSGFVETAEGRAEKAKDAGAWSLGHDYLQCASWHAGLESRVFTVQALLPGGPSFAGSPALSQ